MSITSDSVPSDSIDRQSAARLSAEIVGFGLAFILLVGLNSLILGRSTNPGGLVFAAISTGAAMSALHNFGLPDTGQSTAYELAVFLGHVVIFGAAFAGLLLVFATALGGNSSVVSVVFAVAVTGVLLTGLHRLLNRVWW